MIAISYNIMGKCAHKFASTVLSVVYEYYEDIL